MAAQQALNISDPPLISGCPSFFGVSDFMSLAWPGQTGSDRQLSRCISESYINLIINIFASLLTRIMDRRRSYHPFNRNFTVGVLALQGAFDEHLKLLQAAATSPQLRLDAVWKFMEIRNASELAQCNALIIPGGESTTIALVAAQSNLLEPLREFVK